MLKILIATAASLGMLGAAIANVWQARPQIRLFPLFPMLAWSMAFGALFDGLIAFGPYVRLSVGAYRALFTIVADECAQAADGRLELAANSGFGSFPLARRSVAARDVFSPGGGCTATIDLDYLLGENGGHLNVNGIAGLGAKTSFLLHVNALLLYEAQRQLAALGVSHSERLQVVPVIFNVISLASPGPASSL